MRRSTKLGMRKTRKSGTKVIYLDCKHAADGEGQTQTIPCHKEGQTESICIVTERLDRNKIVKAGHEVQGFGMMIAEDDSRI